VITSLDDVAVFIACVQLALLQILHQRRKDFEAAGPYSLRHLLAVTTITRNPAPMHASASRGTPFMVNAETFLIALL
jgi:hypothetical protein